MDYSLSPTHPPPNPPSNRPSAEGIIIQPYSIDRSILLSRLSKRRRELSPEEAFEIKKSTWIPVDKDLVATNNFSKISGKQFTAVGVQVKEGNPIPEHLFKREYKRGPLHQQIIYELQPKKRHLQYQNQSSSENTNRNIYKSEYPIEPTQITTPIKATSPLQQISNEQFKISQSPFENRSNKNSIEKVELKSGYFYRKGKKAGKSSYKYNLFSVFDEAVNTNCGSCGSNEIIATKKTVNWQ